MDKIKVRWLVAHEPEYLFIRTAEAFAKELDKVSGGRIEVEIITKKIFQEKYGKEVKANNPMELIESGFIQMTQTQIHVYGERYVEDFKVLDMPFLFDNHDHATRVLEGPIGKELCRKLSVSSPLTGLAFTYSGGWRIIGSNKPITNLEELSKTKIRVNKNPVNFDAMEAIGATPVKTIGMVEGYGYDKLDTGELDAVESTYLRFLGTSILKTNHSMFLTNISVNTEFLNSLEPELQEAFRSAAFLAARVERVESIEDAEVFERDCISKGVTIYDMPEDDRNKFRESMSGVYEKWSNIFSDGLVDSIRKA